MSALVRREAFPVRQALQAFQARQARLALRVKLVTRVLSVLPAHLVIEACQDHLVPLEESDRPATSAQWVRSLICYR